MVSRRQFLRGLFTGGEEIEPKSSVLSDEELFRKTMEYGYDPATLTKSQMERIIADHLSV